MKKNIIILMMVVSLFSSGMLFAQGQGESGADKPIKIGITTPSADHGWTGGIVWWVNKRIGEYEQKYGDKFDFTYVTADSSAKQIEAVDNLLSKGIEYLVIQPVESAPLTSTVKAAHSQGVKCIVVDRGLTDTSFGYINLAGDNTMFGEVAGEWVAQQMIEKSNGGNLVVMGGMPVEIDKERMSAFFKGIDAEPSIVNLMGKDKYEFANWSTQKGLEVMETFLTKYPHIDAVFCQDDDVLTGVLKAYEESGRNDIHTIFGGAGSKVVIKKILDGDPLVRATVTYPADMAAVGLDYAVDVALGNKSDDFHDKDTLTNVVLPSVLITEENAEEYYQPDSIY
jgi:ribose transport system substrate-binding protein